MKLLTRRDALQEQIDSAIRLRAIGCTFEMIAWKMGISKDRARTLVGKALRQRREAADSLSPRERAGGRGTGPSEAARP